MVRVTLTKQQFDAVCVKIHPFYAWGAPHTFGEEGFFTRSHDDFDYLLDYTKQAMREERQ